ncbi:flagellar motor switch phosphatase FliY [Peribacillus deserti]|uniref:Flagellar motor switch phosphatase FliY n=1 Tax=Peribacillus deserti TaxID=673318 RepID=A0A2N5MB32_9BACI|nr:flagellar motor switch phosphatase FliY [Peribacillus deserti]PLT31556.1 flagellar motor switch phosphatase FliY [Peribacillus deserti]
MVSDEMLSQDEIDALLRGDDFGSDDNTTPDIEDYFTTMEKDALGEIGNISFESSATALSTLLNQKVDITTPSVDIISAAKLEDEFPHPYVGIQVKYTAGFSGTNLFVIKQSDAAIIADLMLGGDGLNPSEMMGEIQLSAVQEAMNQMMGSAATSMSTIFNKKVDISPPSIDLLNMKEGSGAGSIPDEDLLARISFRLKVGTLIDSNIMQLLPHTFAKSLVHDLLNPPAPEPPPSTFDNAENLAVKQAQSSQPSNPESTQSPLQGVDLQPNYPADPVYMQQNQGGQSYAMQQPKGPQHFGTGTIQPQAEVNVQPASFSSFNTSPVQEQESSNLDILLDIPLQVTVELGRTKRSVKELLELSSGSIIELDKLAGEPVDVLVNNRLIAKGEVVVIDENFGVRVTDIISQSDRIKKLR